VSQTVDARGLPCPRPVVLTRKAMQEHAALLTIVDNETSQHNVTRMAEKAGYTVHAIRQEDGIYLHINRGDAPAEVGPQPAGPPPAPALREGPLVLVVQSEFMGRGEHDELGDILMRGFFHTLGEVEPLPDSIIFFNSGVKLVAEGSPVLEDLQALQQQGLELLACGTCLGYYDLKDQVAVGEVSNMYTIAETILQAGKVVNL
jgi:selenium metabolism protein YedF